MPNSDINQEKIVKYWKDGSRKSLKLAKDVLQKKHYDHALFCGHLALEKLLKSKAVAITNKPAPHSHDLLYLAGLSKIDLSVEQQKFLAEVNTFNIEGRYPEEKLAFYHRSNKDFAVSKVKNINTFYLWLSRQSGEKSNKTN